MVKDPPARKKARASRRERLQERNDGDKKRRRRAGGEKGGGGAEWQGEGSTNKPTQAAAEGENKTDIQRRDGGRKWE